MQRAWTYCCILAVSSLLVVSLLLISSSNPLQYQNPETIQEDFEKDFGEWTPDAQVPPDPKNPGHLVEWNITRAADKANSGQYSVKLFIDGWADDGTIWIERKTGVRKNSQIQVKVSFVFHSEEESFNTMAVVCAYAGVGKPAVEEDFAVVGSANKVAGWKNYTYATTFQTGSSEEVWVAVGISVRWESYMTYYIDDVQVETRYERSPPIGSGELEVTTDRTMYQEADNMTITIKNASNQTVWFGSTAYGVSFEKRDEDGWVFHSSVCGAEVVVSLGSSQTKQIVVQLSNTDRPFTPGEYRVLSSGWIEQGTEYTQIEGYSEFRISVAQDT